MDPTTEPERQVERRLHRLAEVGAALAESIDYDKTLDRLADLMVPDYADWCAIDLIDEESKLCQRVTVRTGRKDKEAFAEALRRDYAPDPLRPRSIVKTVQTGETDFTPDADASWARVRARDERHRSILEQMEVASAISVPLRVQDRVVGAFSLVASRYSGRSYTMADVEFVEEVSRRASIALHNAWLHRELQQELAERKRSQELLAKAALQKDALFLFVERRQRADSLEEIYEAGLDAILSAVGCDRASILLLDDSSVMRFVAWRGLSQAYRAAVEGHSPWTPDASDPEPVCVPDVSVAEIDDSLRATVTGEGIGALAFIPLVMNGRLAGKFMTYYDAPHFFDRDEVELSLSIARQIALGIERKRAETALRESEANARRLLQVQKQAEKELQSFSHTLERIVDERTRELQEANAALRRDMEERKKLQEQLLQAQKMETIGILAGGIAHEFNNILNIVQAYTFILRGQTGENRQVGEGLGVIDKTVQRGSGLVQQLLTLARKSSAHLESINVNHLVEGLIPLIRQTFPKTIEVSASLQTGLPPIMADRNQIEQALLNLCLNARDALPDGGEVSFETRCVPGSAVQHLGGLTAARYVCLAVRDNGAGIADAVRSRMFEPFVTTKESGQGAGLGLSVVYGIVKSHEGLIDVESAAGAGAVFRLYFPAEAADEAQRPQLAPNGKRAGGAITVLVVEDERIMLHVLETTLSQAGYNVLTAADGAAAVETYCRHKGEIALAVLDMGLPKVMGRDVLLRFKEENPALKVVVVSGYLEADVEMESRWDGLRFLHKPYMLDELVQTIQTLLAT